MNKLSPKERIQKTLNGEKVDRLPFCFWHHFRQARNGEELANLTFNFFKDEFKQDIIKIMPDIAYPVAKNSVSDAVTLSKLMILKKDAPFYQENIRCVKLIRKKAGSYYPLILTLFSPLSFALRFMGKKNGVEMARKDPDSFMKGLKIISSNLLYLIDQVVNAGISGIFLSIMGANSAGFTRNEYMTYASKYDLEILNCAKECWLNILHLHTDLNQKGDEIYFDSFEKYPAQVFSWSDRINGPSLVQIFKKTGKCLMGGIGEKGELVTGNEKSIRNEIADAVKQTGGKRLILACGCSFPDDIPKQNIHIARSIIEETDIYSK
jgi:uroporphyrinogen decarboxylase